MLTLLFTVLFHVYQLILGVNSSGAKFPPPLSREEEQAAFLLARAGDEQARERLILHNLRLVSHIVRKYYASSPEPEDLVSIGTVGLIKAVDSFRADKTTHFATYAAKCIQNEILMYFRSKKKRKNEISMNEAIDEDRDGNPLTYMDILSVSEDMAEDVDKKAQAERALRLMGTVLDERERQVIVMRYGLLGLERSFTQREIAQRLSISRSYVSRIEKSALEKLKSSM